MSREDDLGCDLLIRARRDMLLDGEERRLLEAIESSSETRLLYEAGCAFDREAPVLPGDDARIERMLRAVEEREPRRRAPARPRPVWQALAMGMLIGAVAVAAGEASKSLLWPAPATPATPATLASAARTVLAARLPAAAPPDDAPPVQPVPPEPPLERETSRAGGALPGAPRPAIMRAAREPSSPPTAPGQVEPGVAPVPTPASSVRPAARFEDPVQVRPPDTRAETATELFRAANLARMQADSTRAMAAYLRLESEFPQSAEALIARLSLGMLYLHAGQASLALEQFRVYRAVGRGPTLGEALWGESLALHQLDRRAEERTVLQELLERFPESAYTGAVRKRLMEP